MKISTPCIITSRLLPGLRVNDAELSIEFDGETHDGRAKYRYWIDIDGEPECTDNDLHSGVGGGSLNRGLGSLLSFLSACGESRNYRLSTGKDGENEDLFPEPVAAWAAENSDELSMLGCEIEETNPIAD